jgi:hypothetical protein
MQVPSGGTHSFATEKLKGVPDLSDIFINLIFCLNMIRLCTFAEGKLGEH